MAITADKFLGKKKGGALAVRPKTNIVPVKDKGSDITGIDSENPTLVIRTKLIRIEDILKGTLAAEKKAADDRRKAQEQEERSEAEEDIEDPKSKTKVKLPLPGKIKSWWENIKRFFFTVLFGWLFLKFMKWLPKLKGILNLLAGLADFLIEFGGKILNGLVTFVSWGMKAYDWTKDKIEGVFGKKGVEVFDKISGVLSNALNLIMGLGLAMIALSNEFGTNIGSWIFRLIRTFTRGGIGNTRNARLLLQLFGKKGAKFLLGKGATTAATTTTQLSIPGLGGAAATTTTATGTGSAATTTASLGVAGTAAVVAGAGLLASGLGEGAFQLNKWGEGKERGFKQTFDSFKWWKNPLKKGWYGALWLIMKTLNVTFGTVGTLLDVIGAPFRYLIELIRYPFLDEAGKAKQRKNLAKFDARIREQFREIVHAFSLGTLAKDKGAFGSLYGKEGTDAMGYTKDGKTKSRQAAIQAGMLLLSTPDLVATQDLLSGKPSGEMVHKIEEVIKGGRKVDFKGLDKTASYEDGSDTTVYATVPREKVDRKQDMKDPGIETTGLTVGGGGSSDSYADFLYKKAG